MGNAKISFNKCLVTGVSGFVGRPLCRRLLDQGFEVVGAVRRPMDFPEFAERAFTQVAVGGVDGGTQWERALDGVDVVFHLAADGDARGEPLDVQLQKFRKINVEGTRALARAATLQGAKRFIYVSSIKANGEETPFAHPFSEQSVPHPTTPYGISKWEAEQALWEALKDTPTEGVILRPPLVYGPGVKGNFLQLLKLTEKKFPLPFAGLENRRSLIYLDNLNDAIILCATHPEAAGKTYLVSDGEDVSTGELVEGIARALNVDSRLFYFPAPLLTRMAALVGRSEQTKRLLGSLSVDSNKIRRELGWQPPYTCAQGIKATADWYLRSR